MDGLHITLLGTFRVSRGDVVLPVPGARLQALLVRLALAGGRAVEPGVLVDAVWGDAPPSGTTSALQTLVSRLRRALTAADGVLVQADGGYRLTVDTVDAVRFEELAAAGRERLRAGDAHAANAVLTEAVALWGEPAPIAAVAPAVATRLTRLSIEAAADLAEAELSLGRAEAAAGRLSALLAEHPAHERAAGLLMDALAAQGRQAEALTVYERVRQNLAETLGADPGTALRERHLRLLQPAPAPDRPRPAPLPAPVTSFIGRDDDLARVAALLTTGRLVTVLGPGGAGKTRLALEAARRHGHDVRLVDLASVTEPAKVGPAVLAGIGLRGNALFDARRRAGSDVLDVLAVELGGRDCLLLLDNCEHLIDAVARLVATLLPRCPALRVLATSREPLAVDGEALVPLGPLALPGLDDDVREVASVRLFTERAAAVRPGFAVDETTRADIVRVVRGLDGLPLALELAAARLRTLSLPDLADGLADRFRLLTTGSRTAPPRHRTLRAVIAWSWELLDERERTVADRISVLPGGVTPASAAAVCAGTGVRADELPELLAALVDRSLLQLAPGSRYRMLETIREYGIDRLTGTGDLGRVRDLAAAHFAALVTRHDAELRGPGQPAAMEVIAAEYDNTLAALRHRCASRDSPAAIALALGLTWYWQMFGRDADAGHWLGEALAVPGGEPTPERDCARAAHLLNRADILSGITPGEAADDRAGMRELAARLSAHPGLPSHHRVFGPMLLFLLGDETALPKFRQLADGDDAWLSGLAHRFQAEIAENAGELERVRVHVEAALAGFRRAGDRWGRAATLPMRAQLRRYDDLDGALADLREARALAGEFGSLSLGDRLYTDLRWIDLHIRRGETGRALAMIGATRERVRRSSTADMPVLIDGWEAGLRVRLGDLREAGALLDDAERRLLGDTGFPSDHARTLLAGARSALCLARGDRAGAAEAVREAYAAALAARDLPILSLVTVHTAALAAALGRPRESAVLLGAAARLRGAHDRTDPQVRELTGRGRTELGEDGFAVAYAKGWALDAQSGLAAADPARLAL
ncbi:BTAD domain-containing putative transcriptional regulator [Amycolatopsis plumensis]|uniref:BTAD domain-containing putative transcriptional regulator n=1 Tax=Amycolatopsis plumensis TaxID=236508 RepID=A0ABV5UDC0_9PSEU